MREEGRRTETTQMNVTAVYQIDEMRHRSMSRKRTCDHFERFWAQIGMNRIVRIFSLLRIRILMYDS